MAQHQLFSFPSQFSLALFDHRLSSALSAKFEPGLTYYARQVLFTFADLQNSSFRVSCDTTFHGHSLL